MKIIKTYQPFNFRRYGNPWVAVVNPATAKPDFKHSVGGYTGGYNRGEAGDLYVTNPIEGVVYMYGQKDHRGKFTEREYAKYIDGAFAPVAATELLAALQG